MNGVCVINFSAPVYCNEERCQPELQCCERKEWKRKRNLICVAHFLGVCSEKEKAENSGYNRIKTLQCSDTKRSPDWGEVKTRRQKTKEESKGEKEDILESNVNQTGCQWEQPVWDKRQKLLRMKDSFVAVIITVLSSVRLPLCWITDLLLLITVPIFLPAAM